MKRTFTQQPVVPQGYTGRNFNGWQNYLQKQREKMNGKTLNKKAA